MSTTGEDNLGISRLEGATNFSDPQGRFEIVASDNEEAGRYLHQDAYSTAVAFIEGKFDVRGDILAAIRHFSDQVHGGLRQHLFSVLAKVERLKIRFSPGYQSARRDIQFHYDRSNEFYEQFLDSRMVYSAAYFEDPSDSLEKAQLQKLDRICQDLVLQRGERLLDIGCGWGGLICHAAGRFGVHAFGCTLSQQQLQFARNAIERQELENLASVELLDYREIDGRYDKIASVGMFEHVGHARLPGYFRKAYSMLNPGGLFLNRGVIRLRGISDSPETYFLQRHVFPGGELVHLDDVVREGQRAGFEVIGLRDLRSHYAITCHRWVENLQKNAPHCRDLVGESTYRTWLVYLAASAVGFENVSMGAAQVLFSKRR